MKTSKWRVFHVFLFFFLLILSGVIFAPVMSVYANDDEGTGGEMAVTHSSGGEEDGSTNDPNSGNGEGGSTNDQNTGSGSSSGPSLEELAVQAAQQRRENALRFQERAAGTCREAMEAAERTVSDANAALAEAEAALVKSRQGGDPVLVTTGKYLLEEEDFIIDGSSFGIRRKYVSEGIVSGSNGNGWLLSLDSRIIRGTTSIDEAILGEIEGYLKEIEENCGEIDTQYGLAAEIAEQIQSEIYQPALTQYEDLLAEKTRGETLSGLNNYSRFPGTPYYYEGIGNENLALVAEGGSPKTYEPAGTGVWVPMSYPDKLYERIESKDGGGADSQAGFIYYGRGGITREYNENGLLVKVTELDGNSVEIIRNSEGKITSIKGPHGAEYNVSYTGNFITTIHGPEGTAVRYGYNGNLLVWVQDKDGDTVRYVYEGGRLKEIVKPDNSAIRLTYGLSNGETELVTATAHEEGASERFDYDTVQRLTTYTNHSGVVTRYWYDEKHRTTREEHSNGTVKEYRYNDFDQLEWERINGFEIRYNYDGRGNTTEKAYGDGTRERWEYNGKDQRTRYTDRDGVVTEWRYDSRGNCVEIYSGGVRIYTGAYDEKNRLAASCGGDRAEARYEYDARDYLKSRTVTINGQEIKELFEYDGLGRLIKYTDGTGREWKYTITARETKEETPEGLERRYIYNNRKDLVQVTERDTKTGEIREIRIEYDRRHLPIEITDNEGNTVRNEYRADGELVRREQGSWYWEYEYEAGGRIASITRGKEGTDERYTENYSYTQQGNGAQTRTVTLPGEGSNSFGINAFGQITNVTNALGENLTRTVNGAGNVTREQGASGGYYEYRYDAMGRMTEAGRENERGVQVRYNSDRTIAEKTDRLGNVTRYVYDGRGLPVREITALGEERYYYDNAGRVIRREIASRNSSTVYYTQWQYNDEGRTVTITAGGTYTETLYLNAWGEIIRRTDGEGNERRYEYDKVGNLVKAVDGYGNATGYEWNEIGNIKKITYADITTLEYEYDRLGNLIEITDVIGTMWAGEYDEAGRLKKETGRPGIDREYGYDVTGRITEVRNGGEVVERYRYTERGREVIYTDGEGNNFSQQKNGYGELTTETNRLSDSQRYIYDAEGRITVSTAYSGKQTRVEYRDSEGITITTYSDGTQNIIERDKAGNIIRVTSNTGTIMYRYDAGGMLVEQNDEGAGEITRYAYNRAGQRARMASGNRDVQYYYGKNNELTYIRDTSQRLEVRYEYDNLGRETRRTYGNGIRQETLYDRIGRVILIKETDSQNRLLRAEGYVYDEQGRRSHNVDEEGRVTKYEYNNKSQLVTVLYPWTTEKAESDRKEAEEVGLYFTADRGNGERYTFNSTELTALRNVLNIAVVLRGNAVQQSQTVWRETYTYDRNGNRASKTTPWGTIRYEYDAENRLIRKGDIAYTNDKDGNVLFERGLRYEAAYEYNGQNRMAYSEVTSHVDRTHTVTMYDYDALGRRTLTQSVTGQTLRTLYDGRSFEVIREGETFRDRSLTTRFATRTTVKGTTISQTPDTRYRWIGEDGIPRATTEEGYAVQGSRYGSRGVTLYGNGEAVAVSSSTGGRSVYLGKDILGSVKTATTDNGALEERYEYDAFGTLYQGDLSGGMNLGYLGKPYDSTTGLYNYGYRDYSSQAARFTTVDPIRDGNNWYVYVNNDPVNYIDLWGLDDFPLEYVLRLMRLQLITRTAAMYLKGRGGRYPITGAPGSSSTFCNQATFDIAIATGFNQEALFGKIGDRIGKRDDINANAAARNLANAAARGLIERVSGGRAQELADMGYTVIGAQEDLRISAEGKPYSGHVATVAPSSSSSNTFPENSGPLVSNVGGTNGLTSATEAFRGNPEPVYYYYDPNQKLDKYDDTDVAVRKEQPLKGR